MGVMVGSFVLCRSHHYSLPKFKHSIKQAVCPGDMIINTHGPGHGPADPLIAVPYHIKRKDLNILLLENVHPAGVKLLKDQGFNVECLKSITPEELLEKIPTVHVLGVRSKTQVTAEVIGRAKRLMAVGCFCIGTDQTDLDAAAKQGIPVFNAPFSNTRSVAEAVIAEIIFLSRQLGDRNTEMHQGIWKKTAAGCYEVRGKTLGIIGYGHVGSQVSLLAESMGMRVIVYDHQPKLMLGNAVAVPDLDSVLTAADFVSLHVPLTPTTKDMIGQPQLQKMKPGSYLLNLARGQCVDIPALAAALKSGHIAGASVDVFPHEPLADGPGFTTELHGCPNTILTPHIGGSTLEAQEAISIEVAGKLLKCLLHGSTVGSVNFPNLEIPDAQHGTRLINIHKNVPGVLATVNKILSRFNIEEQVLGTNEHIGYLIARLSTSDVGDAVRDEIAQLESSIRTRHIPSLV